MEQIWQSLTRMITVITELLSPIFDYVREVHIRVFKARNAEAYGKLKDSVADLRDEVSFFGVDLSTYTDEEIIKGVQVFIDQAAKIGVSIKDMERMPIVLHTFLRVMEHMMINDEIADFRDNVTRVGIDISEYSDEEVEYFVRAVVDSMAAQSGLTTEEIERHIIETATALQNGGNDG